MMRVQNDIDHRLEAGDIVILKEQRGERRPWLYCSPDAAGSIFVRLDGERHVRSPESNTGRNALGLLNWFDESTDFAIESVQIIKDPAVELKEQLLPGDKQGDNDDK